MDILQLYQDFSVDYLTEGHKHCRPGWVNTECPWCSGNPGYHLGYEMTGDYYVCWRCGWHPIVPTIAKLINMPEKEAYHLVKKYGALIARLIKEPVTKIRILAHRMPSDTMPLLPHHKKYLEDRGFDPDYLEKEYKLLSTGPSSTLTSYRTLDYKNRILIPYIWNGEQVSYDTRVPQDLAPHEKRYKACPEERELIPHKEILYGKQDKWTKSGVLVEGPTDVWRFGSNSFAVSGIKYTAPQVRAIAHTFSRVAVCFDDDPQAIIQSNKIVAELKFRGVDTFRVDIEGDPGSMKQSEADYLVKQLIK